MTQRIKTKLERIESAIDSAEETEMEIKDRFRSNLETLEYNDSAEPNEGALSPMERFCADTLQPRQYYEKIMKGTAGKRPDHSTLMSLCAGLCLSPKASNALFISAGQALSWDREDMAYKYILTHLRGKYIEDINVFLDELGIPPIGAKANKPKEATYLKHTFNI